MECLRDSGCQGLPFIGARGHFSIRAPAFQEDLLVRSALSAGSARDKQP